MLELELPVMRGFIVRLVLAIAISWIVWRIDVTPFPQWPVLAPDEIMAIARVVNFPAAVAGEFTYPLRSGALLFDDGWTWCDFCSSGQRLRQHLEVAVPAWLFVLYVPAMIRGLRRNRRLAFRVVIGLLIYVAFATPYFVIAASPTREAPYAAKWLLILAAAAAVTWSDAKLEWRAAGVIAVILDGAWVMAVFAMFTSPKIDAVLPFYPMHLGIVFTGVVTFLWLVWGFEKGAERLQILHPGVAHDGDDGGAAA
jgi:hypothetical protein